ncbi:MAG: hypothetical protein ABI890_13670, partial [Lapillicoccus sp.]
MTRRRVVQPLVAACLLVLAAVAASASTAGRAGADPVRTGGAGAVSVVLIGAGGLVPQDLDPARTPALWSLLRDGSSAALNVTGVRSTTCPLDGWLTLSAGDRAAGPDVAGPTPGTSTAPCPALPAVTGNVVTGWETYQRAAAARPYDSLPGTLAATLAAAGQCVAAIGPGAAVGAALPATGAVAHYRAFDAKSLSEGLVACRTTLVDIGSVDMGAGASAAPRADQVAALDVRVAAVVAAAPPGADILVVGLSDDGSGPRLRLVLAGGPGFGPGTLYSPSTRQPGLAQLEDVTATAIQLASLPVPPGVSGSALRRVPAANNGQSLGEQRRASLVDVDAASRAVQPVVEPFFLTWGILMVAALAVLAAMWWRGWGTDRQRAGVRSGVRKGLVVASAVPAATFLANLVPWWRFAWPAVALVVVVAVWAGLIGMVALLGAWRQAPIGPPAAVALMTALVVAGDVMTGSRLQLSALLGLNPIVGGRFYGLGNVSFALFAAAVFLVAIAAAQWLRRSGRPRAAAVAVGALGLVAVVIDAAPAWGADAGGPPALIPGIAVLVLAVLRVRVTWRRALLLAGGTLAAVLVIAGADWLRPTASRSHLGRFVQSMIDGQGTDIITRKLAQNLDTLTGTTVLAYLVPVGIVLTAWVCLRPESLLARPLAPLYAAVDPLRAGLVGLTLTVTIGLFLNDTGVAIPPVAWALTMPLVASAALRVWELQRD